MAKMDEKMTCEVVQDLLPLYTDGACTEGSKRLVEEHIKTCEGCKKQLGEMGVPIEGLLSEPVREKSETEVMLADALKKMRANSKRVVAVCLAVLIAIPLFVFFSRELTGQGLCLSSLEEYRCVKNTVTSWVEQGSNAAVDSMSPFWLFEDVRLLRTDREILQAYGKVAAYDGDYGQGKYACMELMGECFYVPGDSAEDFIHNFNYGTILWQERTELYAAGDELGLICSFMKDGDILVPETLFHAAVTACAELDAAQWKAMELEGEIFYYYEEHDAAPGRVEFESELLEKVPGAIELTEKYWILRGIAVLPETANTYFEAGYERTYGYYQTYNDDDYDSFRDSWSLGLKELLAQLEREGYAVTGARLIDILRGTDARQRIFYRVTWMLDMGDSWMRVEFDARDCGEGASGCVCYPVGFYCYDAPNEVQMILDRLNQLCNGRRTGNSMTLGINHW